MLALLSCVFPLVMVLVVAVLLPVRLPPPMEALDRQRAATDRDTRPVSTREHASHAVPYLLIAFALTALLAVTQLALFRLSAQDGALFTHRGSDTSAYPFLPSLFLGIVMAFPIYFRYLQWRYGARLVDILDRPDRSQVPTTLRQEMQMVPALAWVIAGLATGLNLAAFDSFLQITERELRYSAFFSPVTHRRPISEIAEVAIYSRRRAPNGNIIRRQTVELRFSDGQVFDTYYSIQSEHIPEVLAVFEEHPVFTGKITRVDGVKR